ncbi:hypothetical protein DTO207G8_2618 [Paecilomyces variotii]|nr:hypothetical protein DTO207G8_2618 [Paecilomyces variotii]KAJ9374619.1 hypothetical protein DTO282E5_702 [Paecilomyces variotii]
MSKSSNARVNIKKDTFNKGSRSACLFCVRQEEPRRAQYFQLDDQILPFLFGKGGLQDYIANPESRGYG